MKKLLVVGSCSIHTYNFIEMVRDHFDEVLFLTNKNCKKSYNDIDVMELDFRFIHLFTIVEIKKILKNFDPTHIHIHQANSFGFFTLAAAKYHHSKKILNIWGSDIFVNPKRNKILKQIVKFNLKYADYVIGDSDVVLNEAKKIYPKITTENINFGVNVQECRKEKQNIVYSNRMHKKLYNIDKIIISFSKFLNMNKEKWKLIIAGEGEETDNLKNLAQSLGIEKNVEFVGFVDNETNNDYYCKSKIYVSIPESDSVSLSLVEAVLNRCVVFVSDIDANKEIVNENFGFIENDLSNIDFSKYVSVSFRQREKELEKIKKMYSKEYNRERLFNLYAN